MGLKLNAKQKGDFYFHAESIFIATNGLSRLYVIGKEESCIVRGRES